MIKTMPDIAEVKHTAIQAQEDAYGRTQATPDGMYCRIGRIDRAYRTMAQKSGGPKYQAAITALEDAANDAFAQADKALSSYIRLRKMEGLENDIEAPICDCSYCSQPTPTFNGVKL